MGVMRLGGYKVVGGALVVYAVVNLVPVGFFTIVRLFLNPGSLDLLGIVASLLQLISLVYLVGGTAILLSKPWGRRVIVVTALSHAIIKLGEGVFSIWLFMGTTTEDDNLAALISIVVFENIVGIGIPVFIAFIAWKMRFDTAPATVPRVALPDDGDTPVALPPAWGKLARPRLWFWSVIGWGGVLPLLTGLWVRIELQMAGKPVLGIDDWDRILFVTAYFAIPFVVYAFLLRSQLGRTAADPRAQDPVRLSMIAGGFVALTIASIWVMHETWQSPDSLAVMILVPHYLMAPAAVAAIVGMKVGELMGKRLWQPGPQ